MSKRKTGDAIYLEQWLDFHPYMRPAQSDYYYLKLCNEFYAILKDDFDVTEFELSSDETKCLACFLACYFEDVISGPGLWRVFTRRTKELYGTWLPFYKPANGPYFTGEYFPEEINYADINFLLWYFFSILRMDEDQISPEYIVDSYLPGKVFDIMEREYETAPENLHLKQFYSLDPEQASFVDVNAKVRWIGLDSWLLYFTGIEMDQMIDEMMEEEDEESLPEKDREGFVYDYIDSYAMSHCTRLLAMRGNEWLARILGSGHPLYADIMAMGTKKSGNFLYTGEEEGFVLFRHLTTGKVLNVNPLSIDPPMNAIPGISVVHAGFTFWCGSWWFSGSLAIYHDEPDLAELLKDTKHEAFLFPVEPEWKSVDLDGQGRAFLKYNRGKAMAFVADRKEALGFVRGFYLFYIDSLGLRRRERRARMDPILSDIRDAALTPDEVFGPDEEMPAMIFFNPEYGIEVVSDYNDLIPDPDNPWYDPDMPAENSLHLLNANGISGRWARYLVEEYDLPGLAFPGEKGSEILLENLDFMLRFWKERYYYPEIISTR